MSRKSALEKVTSPAQSRRPGLGSRASRSFVSASAIVSRADRHVDEEDPLPAEGVDEHAPHERAHGHPDADARSPDPERSLALARSELLRDQGEHRSEHRRAADSLQAAGDVERERVRGEPREERGGGECGEPDREDELAAQPVGERPRHQRERGEGEDVGVDDPLQVGQARAEVTLDLGQGDVHDRDVEQEHERRDRDSYQCPPFTSHFATSVSSSIGCAGVPCGF